MEKIHGNALRSEPAAQSIRFTPQERFSVYYRSHIVEIAGYLIITRLQIGIIHNLKPRSLPFKREAIISRSSHP
jgi:hypothetical protein